MAEALSTKDTFSTALTTQLDSIGAALPAGFNKSRFVQNALALLNDNPDLAKYGKQQIIFVLMKGAILGLDFLNHEAYPVPYGNKLQYQTSYAGSVKLAKKYSIRPIKDIYAKIVREGDEFEEVIVNGEPTINFKPKPFNDGKVVGAFAVCLFADGGIQYDTMSFADLENTRSHSKAKNSPAWTNFPIMMYQKTVLKRLCKHIEIDFESADQRLVYDEESAVEDVKDQVEDEIVQNANTEEFVEAEEVTDAPFM